MNRVWKLSIKILKLNVELQLTVTLLSSWVLLPTSCPANTCLPLSPSQCIIRCMSLLGT